MKINRFIMKIGFITMVAALLISFGYTYYLRLDNPVFLRYCIETLAVSNLSTYESVMQLQYVSNYDDDRYVIGISFQEEPDMLFSTSETPIVPGGLTYFHNPTGQTVGSYEKYRIHTIYVQQLNYYREEWVGEKEINTASIHFNDGSSITVDIGRIIIYSETTIQDAISNFRSTSTYNESYQSSFLVTENLSLDKIDSPLLKELLNVADLKIADRHYDLYHATDFTNGSNFEVNTDFKTSEVESFDYDVYDIRPKLSYKQSNGTSNYTRVYYITWQRNLTSFQDMLSYLKKREAF